MSTPELRRLWRRYHDEHDRLFDLWEASDYDPKLKPNIPFPEELRGLTCGARTRAGTPCKQTGLYRNGRCKLHGGLSTGPTTDEGRRKSSLNGLRPKRKRSS